MLVKFVTSVAGERFCFNEGEVHDLPDKRALEFVKDGHAESVGIETAAKRGGDTKGRKHVNTA